MFNNRSYYWQIIGDIINDPYIKITTTPSEKTVWYKDGKLIVNDEETPRYIENPEWKKKQIENKINHNNSLIGMYEERILQCRNEIKELEKELKGK